MVMEAGESKRESWGGRKGLRGRILSMLVSFSYISLCGCAYHIHMSISWEEV